MGKIKDYLFPRSLTEAVKLCKDKNAVIVAGGTGVVARRKSMSGKTLVDITRLKLDEIKAGKGHVKIGSCVSMSEIAESAKIKALAGGVLSKAADNVGSLQIKNQVTAGGNVLTGYPWSDTPPALMCLDAELVFKTEKSERVIACDEYFEKYFNKTKDLGLLTEIRIPDTCAKYKSDNYVFQKTDVDYSMVTFACTAQIKAKKLADIKIAVSACTKLPVRLKKLETELIKAGSPDKDTVELLCRKHCAKIVDREDFRLSKDYAAEILVVHLTRSILSLMGKEA